MRRPKVIDIKTKKPVKIMVDKDTYIDLCDAVLDNIENVQPETIAIINEMKFNACFNPQFRFDTYVQLEEFLYELYEKMHS